MGTYCIIEACIDDVILINSSGDTNGSSVTFTAVIMIYVCIGLGALATAENNKGLHYNS